MGTADKEHKMNMLDMAKDLIDKGNELNDPELVAMGMQMLEKYTEQPTAQAVEKLRNVLQVSAGPEYECVYCKHVMPFDKPDRKKCPVCKKHGLALIDPHIETFSSEDKEPAPRRHTAENFSTQIRQTGKTRIRYNEDGVPEGTYSRTEQVEGMTTNIFEDDKTEGFDKTNELLKQFTKFTPRTRKPPRMVKVTCNECKTQHEVHPIHAGGRGRFICDKCVKRRSRV